MKAMLAALGVCVMASTAAAQESGDMTWKERMTREMSVFAGIGVGDYSQDLGDVAGAGFAWNLRAGIKPFRYFGAELNYLGINGGVNDFVSGGQIIDDAGLVQNQITFDLTAGYPVDVAGRELEPYVLAGIGYARLGADEDARAIVSDDNALAVPLGVGIGYDITETFVVDGRFTYNILGGVNMPQADGGDSWMLGLNLGAKFGSGD